MPSAMTQGFWSALNCFKLWPTCTKPVLSHIIYSLSMMKEKHSLYTITWKYRSISTHTKFVDKQLLECVELVCDKTASKVWFLNSYFACNNVNSTHQSFFCLNFYVELANSAHNMGIVFNFTTDMSILFVNRHTQMFVSHAKVGIMSLYLKGFMHWSLLAWITLHYVYL